jgi:hypothetical protein
MKGKRKSDAEADVISGKAGDWFTQELPEALRELAVKISALDWDEVQLVLRHFINEKELTLIKTYAGEIHRINEFIQELKLDEETYRIHLDILLKLPEMLKMGTDIKRSIEQIKEIKPIRGDRELTLRERGII